MADASVACVPDPLPHNGTGSIAYATREPEPWCEVGLLRENGDYTSVSFHALFRGDTAFTFGPTPTWDGTGGGQIRLRLFAFRKGVQRTLAEGSGTYLA